MIWASAAARTDLSSGVDDGVLISDRVFGVADGVDCRAGAGPRALREIARRLGPQPYPVPRLIRDAFRGANVALWFADDRTFTLRSTATVVVWWSTLITIGHVGDSRAYLIGGGRVLQLTSDHGTHSSDKDVVRLGRHPRPPDPQVQRVRVRHGDRVVLCTDGIWRHVSTPDLMSCATLSPVEACEALRANVPASETEEASVVVIEFSQQPTMVTGPNPVGASRMADKR